MIVGPRATIDSQALRHNLDVVRRLAGTTAVMAVIKANAYGHGLVPAALALDAADALAVARLAEALTLREAGVRTPLVLLEGVFSSEELEAAARLRLQLVVHSPGQLELLAAWRGSYRFSIWVKVDTGMNRLGFRVEEFAAVWERVQQLRSVAARPRFMTHLAAADEPGSELTRLQLERARRLMTGLGAEASLANSAGLIVWPEARADWVRPGLMLYGMSPFPDRTATQLGLEPAMTLRTQLIAVRELAAGETVGYGASWRAERPARIGIAAIGYGDGYPRHLGSGTPVLVRNRPVALVGRVSMDMIALDLTTLDAAPGDEVVLWGKGLPVEGVAARAGTIAYELVCGISQRVAIDWR